MCFGFALCDIEILRISLLCFGFALCDIEILRISLKQCIMSVKLFPNMMCRNKNHSSKSVSYMPAVCACYFTYRVSHGVDDGVDLS